MRHRGRAVSRHEDRGTTTTIAHYLDLRGVDAVARRACQIATLPRKEWRGETVYKLTCAATFGNGPHVCWLPERVLWALIDLRAYRCVYHL